MSNSPEDIIELTDIIEHGPGAPRQEGEADGVDLSFERELEDLFAESPGAKPAGAGPDLPGLDALHLPDEASKADGGDDIDLDGLDALLAEAEKAQPADMELPELTSDFLSEPEAETELEPELELEFEPKAPVPAAAPAAAAAVAAILATPSEAAGPGLHALSDRLDALEEKLAGMGDSLAASFQSMLDAAIAGLKADLPAPQEPLDEEALAARVKEEVLAGLPVPAEPAELAEAPVPEAPPIDVEALEAQMAARMEALLEERLEAFKAELPATPEPLDEAALAERVKEEVLAGLPVPAEPAELAEAPAPEAPPVDIEALEARIEARMAALMEERLEAFKAELPATPEPLDEEALAERVKEEVLAGLPEPVEPAAPVETPPSIDAEALTSELGDNLRSEMKAMEARLAAEMEAKVADIPAPADPASLVEELSARLSDRLSALEASVAAPAPDLGTLASRDDLAALRLELLAEIKKAVPAAAARIIREEIQALVQEMD